MISTETKQSIERIEANTAKLQNLQAELKGIACDSPPAPSPSATKPPRVMLAFLMGLSVGLSIGAAAGAIAIVAFAAI